MRAALALFCLIPAIMRADAENRVAPESRFAQLDDMRVHYTSYGTGEVTLLFVHGWSCDETVWSEQASALAAEGMRVITVDLPGHGQSSKPEIAYTMHLYARALDAVLRDAKVARAVVIGHSNGTPAVRQFYRESPESVSALVIVEGALKPFVDAAAMEKFLGPMRGPDYPKIVGDLIDGMTKPIGDEKLRARIKSMMLATPQHVAVSEFEATADPELWKPDPINVPVLMILAKQPAWNAEYEQLVRTIAPDVDYQVWENVSHFLMMEKPSEFNAALVKFLRARRILAENNS